MSKNYISCNHCGHDTFKRIFSFRIEEVKVKSSLDSNFDLSLDVTELGVIKDHLDGYYCANCNAANQFLTDSL